MKLTKMTNLHISKLKLKVEDCILRGPGGILKWMVPVKFSDHIFFSLYKRGFFKAFPNFDIYVAPLVLDHYAINDTKNEHKFQNRHKSRMPQHDVPPS